MGSFGPKKEIQLRSVGANSRFSPGDRYYMMLRWGTAAAACLLLGGVRGAVMASNGEEAKPQGFLLKLRGQGQLQYWKVVLTDSDQLGLPLLYSYEHKFHLHSINNGEMEEVHLPLTEFAAFYRGHQVENAPPLDLTKIGAFGLQTFGGVYDEFKQSGVGTLEIDSVSFC